MTDTTDRTSAYEVVVVGSANADLVIEVARHPHAGETVLGGEVRRFPGGKGANQAVAAARAGGARTAFLGALGRDDGAAMLRASLERGGVDTSHIVETDAETGLAVITVSSDADNAIVVAPGANHRLVLDAAETDLVARAGAVLAQLEIPLDTVLAAARAAQGLFLLNAAPAQSLPPELLAQVDVLVVNEHEAAEVAGRPDGPAEPADLAHLAELAEALTEVVPAAVITLGSRGSLVARRDQPLVQIPSLPVQPVDTTGAGDTFCGVLAAQLAAGADLPEAARLASVAGALATTKHGAQPSVPTAAEVADAAQGLGRC
ncbi:MAG: ribokinase [Propionibacteriaceae bacterium]|jgi:ribokinase|nr:ribokinase [Propionibacteriaceae bacterium]